jgi:hypothetical protein
MTLKTLGRCTRRHAQVVEYEDGTMPAGVCKYVPLGKPGAVPCGEQLIEWALKAAPAKESSR